MSVDGVAMTYYADEIKDVDGNPFMAAGQASLLQGAQPAPAAASLKLPSNLRLQLVSRCHLLRHRRH